MQYPRSKNRRNRTRGSVIVEAAVCAPIAFFVLMIGLELGRIAQIKVTTKAVATIAARVAGVPDPDIKCPIGQTCTLNETDLKVGTNDYLTSFRQSQIPGNGPAISQRALRAINLALSDAYSRLGTGFQTPQKAKAGWSSNTPIQIGDREFFIVPLHYLESNNGADRMISLSAAAGGQLAVKDNNEPNEFMACVSYSSTLPILKRWICDTATFARP